MHPVERVSIKYWNTSVRNKFFGARFIVHFTLHVVWSSQYLLVAMLINKVKESSKARLLCPLWSVWEISEKKHQFGGVAIMDAWMWPTLWRSKSLILYWFRLLQCVLILSDGVNIWPSHCDWCGLNDSLTVEVHYKRSCSCRAQFIFGFIVYTLH
jgi:hypothetical protein